MDDFDDLMDELKQKRDELRVQMNLASREFKEEWDELEEKMQSSRDARDCGKRVRVLVKRSGSSAMK